jgi:hypothetical protein
MFGRACLLSDAGRGGHDEECRRETHLTGMIRSHHKSSVAEAALLQGLDAVRQLALLQLLDIPLLPMAVTRRRAAESGSAVAEIP